MAQNFDFVSDDNPMWMVQPYGVLVGRDFSSYQQDLAHLLSVVNNSDDNKSGLAGSGDNSGGSGLMSDIDGASSPTFGTNDTTYVYQSPSVSDASIGGNDAINPYAAFALDDDIVHDAFKTSGGVFGMGRCYSEIYNSKQQIVYLTMGIPKYRNLTTWLKNATKAEMAKLNEDGDYSPKLGDFLASAVSLAVKLPWLPLIWMSKLYDSIGTTNVTEYFLFRDAMGLYYRYVNTLLAHIAVNMGIFGGVGGNSSQNTAATTADGEQGSGTTAESGGAGGQTATAQPPPEDLPEIMKDGPDMFKIVCKRASRLGTGSKTRLTTDQAWKSQSKIDPTFLTNEKSTIGEFFSKFWRGLETSALEGGNFIGFRIERSDQASESFSNSTKSSSLEEKLNSEVQKARDASTGAMDGKGMLAGILSVGKKLSNLKDAITSLGNGNIESTVSYLAAGNGFFDLPKQWAGASGCGRQLSFNMKLRAKTGGDNVSVFQSIMVPLSCLLAAALPHASGDTTYTSPFLVRVFCRGMYGIPAGIINSLTVSRGASEYGWSLNRVPTVVDVSFSIEDLSPMIFLSIAGQGVFEQAFANNTKLHEYLNTLTGIGCKERYFRMGQIKRRLMATWLVKRNTWFSPTYWGYCMGDSNIIRGIMSLTPYHRVANN